MKTQKELEEQCQKQFEEYCKETKLPILFWVVAAMFLVGGAVYVGGYIASIQ